MVIALHRRWRGLRASLRALVATDATARAFYRAQRRRQLDLVAHLGGVGRGDSRRARRRREDAAVLLFTLERVADAIADGELEDLDLALAPTLARLRTLVAQHLDASPSRGRRDDTGTSH